MISPLFLLADSAGAAAELADIREPVRIINWTLWGGVLAGLIVLGTIALLVLRRKRRNAPETPAGPPPPPPGVWARTQLERLAREQERFTDKLFVAEVSDVVRGYLERALRLPAPERTTEEFLDEIREHDAFSPEMRVEMGAFLAQCDLVKFANQGLATDQRPGFLTRAEQFVETTETTIAQPKEAAPL